MENAILTQIPFSGFYSSIHDSEFDREFEFMFEDYAETTGQDMPQALIDGLFDSVNWQGAREYYAKEYVEAFLHEFQIEGAFESLISPRFYNYTTDRVFAYISRDSVAHMWRAVNKRLFGLTCEKLFTSYDGFASSYSPNWKTWGRISQWDHNQIYALVLTYAGHESLRGEFDECGIVEDLSGNGVAGEAIHANIEKRDRDYWAIYDYLTTRAMRKAA